MNVIANCKSEDCPKKWDALEGCGESHLAFCAGCFRKVQLVDTVEAIQGLDQLEQISNASRQIFEAHVFLGMTFTEISVMLRIPKSTVHDRFIKAKTTLRKAFKKLYF